MSSEPLPFQTLHRTLAAGLRHKLLPQAPKLESKDLKALVDILAF